MQLHRKSVLGDERKLDRLLSLVYDESKYYRALLDKLGAQQRPLLGCFNDLAPTSRSDLMDNIESIGSSHRKWTRICSTGGTSGNPLFVRRTEDELISAEDGLRRLYEMARISPKNNILLMLPFGIWNIGHLCMRGAEMAGFCSIPVGTNYPHDGLTHLLQKYKIETVFSSPRLFLHYDHHLFNRSIYPDTSLNVSTIIWAGESFSSSERLRVENRWGAKVISLYGSEETDGLGVECRTSQNGHHLLSDRNYFEILSLNSLQQVPMGQVGRLVVTPLDKLTTPLLRYDLGDLALMLDEPCSCGEDQPRLVLNGRVDDVLILLDGTKIYSYQIEKLMSEHDLGANSFQLQLHTSGDFNIDTLTLLVMNDSTNNPSESDLSRLQDSICSLPDLADMLENGNVRIAVKRCRGSDLIKTSKGKYRRLVNLSGQTNQ